MSLTRNQLEELIQNGKSILENNIRKVDGKTYAIPSGLLYPAAWGWDTPLIALGLYIHDPDTALSLLSDFIAHQWPNGMLPQIVFPQITRSKKLDPESYFPPPHVWYYTGNKITDYDVMDLDEVSDHPAFDFTNGKTTGIPQYPIWAMAIETMHSIKPIPNTQLLPLLNAINSFHNFFEKERDPLKLGCAAEFHPWIGCDNAPCYDVAMQRVYNKVTDSELQSIVRQRVDVKKILSVGGDPSVRPTDKDYACFLYLAQSLARYTEKRLTSQQTTPDDLDYIIYSPMLNSLLIRSDQALAKLAHEAGAIELAALAEKRSSRLHEGMMKTLWDEKDERFLYYDGIDNKHYKNEFLGSYYPLMDQFLAPETKNKLCKDIVENFVKGYRYPLPSTSQKNQQAIEEKTGYDPLCYWRGPTWINLAAILLEHMPNEIADDIRQDLLSLIYQEGFYEYFNPETGKGHGTDRFGWTAAFAGVWAIRELQKSNLQIKPDGK
jgi:hypothetical protein